jgi:ubiquinone/menaquinone biosynthesis C-methylase UbiE
MALDFTSGNHPADDFEVKRTVASYDAAADEYIERTDLLPYYPGLAEELDAFSTMLASGPLADVGTGSGRDAIYLARSGRSIIAVDLSERLLARVSSRFPQASVAAVRADLRHLPIAPQALAGLLCSGTLLHIPRVQAEAALRGFLHVLRKGGVALISLKQGQGGEWYENYGVGPRWMEYYLDDELASLCRRAGFAVERVYGPRRKGWISAVVRRP